MMAAPASAAEATGATSAASAGKRKRWFPLESNPEVMNAYTKNLGFPTDKYAWVDVLSTDDWVRR